MSTAPDGRADDFRRVVALVAGLAVGFFPPALALGGVPPELWPLFMIAAICAGLALGGSFMVIPRASRWTLLAALVNVGVLSLLGRLYHGHFNQLDLLFMLTVAAHAVVHGLPAALLAALLGSFCVPYVMQDGLNINASDPVYAFIYLLGGALVPWTAGRLATRRAAALREQLALTVATEREAVLILARAAEAKDQVTGDHVVRVGDTSALLGIRAGLTEVEAEDLRFAGMLHDVGKLHLPDDLLRKPGPLHAEEWALVRKHTIWGERILGSTAGFEMARRICRSHHENWDGSGYPDGLNGEAIPLVARIVRLADALDAMRNPRPYKEGWPLARCLELIQRGSGSLFDPDLARELLAIYGALPETSPAKGKVVAELTLAGARLVR